MRDGLMGLALAVVLFGALWATTGGFAGSDTNMVASNCVTVNDATPTANDDVSRSFLPGCTWIDQTGNDAYIAEDTGDGAANWIVVGAPAGSGITSLGGQLGSTQTFSATDDTNLDVSVTSSDDEHIIGVAFTGTLPVIDGGTGGANAATARTNLGLAIGTDVAGFDAYLDCLADLASTGMVSRTGVGTCAVRTVTGTADKITVSNGDGASGNPTITIAATYVGQNTITTVGTISTGTWEGTTVAFDHGGTGQTTAPDDNALIGNGTGWDLKAFPSCSNATTSKLLYNTTTNAFTCGTDQSGAGGSGSVTTVKESDTQVGGSDIVTLDFGVGFDLVESPDTEIQIALDYTENPVDLASGDVEGTLPADAGGTGQTAVTADGVLVGNGTVFVIRTLPDCDDSSGNHLNYDSTTDAWTCGTSSSVTDTDTDTDTHIDIDDDNVNEATDIDVIDFGTNLAASCTAGECDITIADVFLFNSGDVGTGTWDFGGATSFELPNGAGGTTVNAAGEITIDTTSGCVNFFDAAERSLCAERTVGISLEDPVAADDLVLGFKFDGAATITEICYLAVGGTNWVGQVQEADNDGATPADTAASDTTAVAGTETCVTTFSNASFDAGDRLFLKTTSISGTPTWINVSVKYRYNP